MKLLKSFVFTLGLVLTFTSVSAQVVKFKSTGISFKTKNETTKRWTNWSDGTETEVLITVDLKNDRIKIFSKEEQVYDIIKYFDKTFDSDGDETLKYHCVDGDGLKCYVRLVKLNSQEGRRQLYVDFADMMWVYNIYVLD